VIHRKSPYRHHVSEHVRRDGNGSWKPVSDYERGKGDKPYGRSRPHKVIGEDVAFDVKVYYHDHSSEELTVQAPSDLNALDEAMNLITDIPKTFVIRRALH